MNEKKPRPPFVNPVELVIFGVFGALFFQTLQHFVANDGWNSTQTAMTAGAGATLVAELSVPCDVSSAPELKTDATSVRLSQAPGCHGRSPSSVQTLQVINKTNGYSGAAFRDPGQGADFSTDLIPLVEGVNQIELHTFAGGKAIKTESISVLRSR